MASGPTPAAPAAQSIPTLFPRVLKNEPASGVITKYMDGCSKRIQKLTVPRPCDSDPAHVCFIRWLCLLFPDSDSRSGFSVCKDQKNKYEAIPEPDRNVAQTGWLGCVGNLVLRQPRILQKYEEMVGHLERAQNEINTIYSHGAVEGYSDQKLGGNMSQSHSCLAYGSCIIARTQARTRPAEPLQKGAETARALPFQFAGVSPRSTDANTLDSRAKSIPLPKASPSGKAKPKAKPKAKAVAEQPHEPEAATGGQPKRSRGKAKVKA